MATGTRGFMHGSATMDGADDVAASLPRQGRRHGERGTSDKLLQLIPFQNYVSANPHSSLCTGLVQY
jgi:hypothetical protein